MKYIEELNPGNIFVFKDIIYLLTCDLKKNGKRLCYCLTDGLPKWFDSNETIENIDLYRIDKDQNILPIKANHNVPNQNNNIS